MQPLQSLVTGRPPIILSSFIDCKIPTPEEEHAFQQGEVPLGCTYAEFLLGALWLNSVGLVGIWGFRFSELLLQVVQATLSAKAPSLEHVLELDKKVRDFGLANPANPTVEDTTALSMRNFVRSHYKELSKGSMYIVLRFFRSCLGTVLLYLHRAFFTQGMTEYPADPMSSPYAHSVVTAYQSACLVLEDTRVQYLKKPALCVRIWRIWSLAFTAAVRPPAFESYITLILL